jgi:hypothetical protein
MDRLGQEHIVNRYLRRPGGGVKGGAFRPAATIASQFLAKLRPAPNALERRAQNAPLRRASSRRASSRKNPQ